MLLGLAHNVRAAGEFQPKFTPEEQKKYWRNAAFFDPQEHRWTSNNGEIFKHEPKDFGGRKWTGTIVKHGKRDGAAVDHYKKIIKSDIKYNCYDINAMYKIKSDQPMMTFLHMAARTENLEMVEFLLDECNAYKSLNLEDANGKRPFELVPAEGKSYWGRHNRDALLRRLNPTTEEALFAIEQPKSLRELDDDDASCYEKGGNISSYGMDWSKVKSVKSG